MPTRCVTDPNARDTPPPSLYTPRTSRAAMLATLVTTASAIVVLPRSVCNGVPGPEPSGRLPAPRVATAALGLLVVCSAIGSSIRKSRLLYNLGLRAPGKVLRRPRSTAFAHYPWLVDLDSQPGPRPLVAAAARTGRAWRKVTIRPRSSS